MEAERTYIPDEQENSRREEEEKDTGISPSVLDVQNYFDSSDSPEETKEKEPEPGNGEGEGNEEGKEQEGQEETQEEEAPEEPEVAEEEHPKDDEEEMFQDRRDRKLYTEDELAGLEEEEPAEEEPESLVDEEELQKEIEARDAKKRHADKVREYYRRHRQGAQGSPTDAAGLESEKSGFDGDDFYEERIRRAYSPDEGAKDESFERNNRSDDLLIEEGDTYVGPPGRREGAEGAGAGQGRYAHGRAQTRPAPANDVSGAKGLQTDAGKAEGDDFYEERIRRAYSPAGEGDSPSIHAGEGKSAPVLVVEEGEASSIPRAGMASRNAGAGYIRSAHAKGVKDPAGAGSEAWNITTDKANGISVQQGGTSGSGAAGTGYGYGHTPRTHRTPGGSGKNTELFNPERTRGNRAGRTAAGASGNSAGVTNTKKKNVPAGSLKSITMDEAPSEGLAKDVPVQAEAASGNKSVLLGGKGSSVITPENSEGAGAPALSGGKTVRLQPAGKSGSVISGRGSDRTTAAAGGSAVVGRGEKPGTIKTTGVISKESAGKTGKNIPGTASTNVAGGTSGVTQGPSAGMPRTGKGIITDAHVTGIIKDWEKKAAAGGGKLTSEAVKAAGISSGYVAPAAASIPGAAGKGIASIGAAAGILPPETEKKKEEEKNESSIDNGIKSISGDTGKTGTGSSENGIIIKRRSIDERLGGTKKSGSAESATDAAGRQERKGLIRSSALADTGKNSKIIAGNILDKEGGKGPYTRAAEEHKKAAGLLRRYQAAHTAPMGSFSPTAGAGGGGKLKVLARALSKKAVAVLLSSTITAGAIAGGVGMASRHTMKGNDNNWTPVQAHILTTDAIALGNPDNDSEEGAAGAASTQETSGTGASTNTSNTNSGSSTNTPNGSGNTSGGTGSGAGNAADNSSAAGGASNTGTTANNAGETGTGSGSTAETANTEEQEEGIPLTQDALEKMFTRMQAYGVLSPYVNYSSAPVTNPASQQNSNAQALVDYAKSWIGKITYKWGCHDNLHAGGQSDCSWFVYHCLMDTGVLPKGTDFIHSYEWGEDASKYPGGVHMGTDLSKAQPGDIICMKSLPHVGIYVGNGEYVECSGHSNAVKIGKPEKSKISNIVRFPGTTNSSSSTGAQNSKAQEMIDYATSWVGKLNYKSGGASKLKEGVATDCNLYVLACLKHSGIIPNDRWINPYDWGEKPSKYPEAMHVGTDVSQAQPGDILVTGKSPRKHKGNSHVAIYIGNGKKVEVVPSGCKIKDAPKKVLQIVRFNNMGTAASSGGGTLLAPTTTRYGFTEGTEAIVEAHMNDFDYHSFDSFMSSHGGAANYVRSLGGVFEKYCGVPTQVQSAGQFQEVAEYVMGLMTIWGPDYHGGGGDHKFNGNHGKGDQYGRFYSGSKIHHWKFGFDIEKVYFHDKEHIMTDCGCGCSYIMYKAGLLKEKQYAGQDEKSEARHRIDVSRGGAIITRKEDLQVGDIVQMSKTKHESGWKHVCVIGEIYPDGTIITYDTGNRYVNSGNYKKVWSPDSDGDFSGDYKGYHSWFGQRIRALDQSDAQTFGYLLNGPATRNLKEIRINSVKVDGKTKNRNKFSYNTLGEYSKHGKTVSAVNVNFTFVDKNRNDIAGTVLANGNQNDASKAKKDADRIIKAAEKYKHINYSPGGNDEKTGMDATHYVYKLLKEAGLYSGKERTVSGWRLVGKKVNKLENAQKGDIIVYKNHVAVYDGDGKIYECSAKTGGAAHSRKAEEPGKIIAIRRLTDDISGSSVKTVNTSAGASGGTTTPSGGGFTINIPSGLGATHTYMGWQCITAPSSNQYKLRSEAGMNFDSEGFGVIKGRYVVACTTTYGNVGDCVDFYKKNGQVIHAVIGDIKSRGDAGCTKWGHHNGRNIIEFVVNKDTWYSNGAGSHVNPGNPSCHPEWASETVKAVNTGSWKNNAAVEHPTSMASPSDLSYTAGQGRSNEEPLYLAMQILSMTPIGANSCKNPVNMDQYDRYCFDILDWAITESYGADVRYTSLGDFYQCDITVDISCDPAKLQKNDSNFKWWDYKHDNGDPQVKSYMDLRRDVYCDVFNVDVYRLLAANASPFSGNEEVVYEFFRSKGLGNAQIAGIMANIKAESNFNPSAVNATSGASGLFQWLGGRLDALKRMAESRGRDWTDIQTQLDYAWEEIQGSGWNGNNDQKEKFMSTTNAREAAVIFCTYFERTGNPADATKRAGYAETYYSTIMNATNSQGVGYAAGGGATDYLQWAINIAKDDSHGYSMASRTGHPDYDCSSLVFYALKACGYNVGSQPFYTGSMSGILQKAGFKRYPFRSKSELQPGDILLIHVEGGDQHTEIYAGDGKNVGAHWNYDGKPGDSGGNEISYGGVGSNWQCFFRSGSGLSNTSSGGGDVVSLLQKWKKEGNGHSQVVENYNKYASKYNVSKMDSGDQWCSETASAAYAALGLADSIGGMSSNGGSYESKAKKIGAWVSDKSYKPKRNDILVTHDAGKSDVAENRHTAVVISCDGNKIKCIAGGGSKLHYQTKTVGADTISGYVVPQGTAASSNAGGYNQGNTYYQPQRGWYRPTRGSWQPPVTPSVVTPTDAPPSSGEPTDNDWGVYIGKEFHGDISQLRGKRQVVIEGQDQSKKEIATIKSSGAKVYSYLSIGSLEEYRPYYKKFNKKKFKLGHYENWNDERWVNTAEKEWRDYVVDHIAEDLKNKGIDSLWLDNTDVYEMFPREDVYQGLLDIVTRLKAKGFTLMYNGGNKFVSRLIKEGKTNLVDAVMQEEVYSQITDYDNDKFAKQDSDTQREHEAYLDRCKAAGIPVSCLEYTRDKSLIEKIKKKCKERGYEYYISGRVNLD